ncbi:unnamed protein product [Calypogeia fissa]
MQATKFKCERVAMSVSICHMTADGQGMMKLMTAWSEIALNDKTPIVPNRDRSLSLPRETFMEFLGAETGSPPPADGNSESKTLARGERNGVPKTAIISDVTHKEDPRDAYCLQISRFSASRQQGMARESKSSRGSQAQRYSGRKDHHHDCGRHLGSPLAVLQQSADERLPMSIPSQERVVCLRV